MFKKKKKKEGIFPGIEKKNTNLMLIMWIKKYTLFNLVQVFKKCQFDKQIKSQNRNVKNTHTLPLGMGNTLQYV